MAVPASAESIEKTIHFPFEFRQPFFGDQLGRRKPRNVLVRFFLGQQNLAQYHLAIFEPLLMIF